jgi:hypothetical protein
MSSNKEEPPVHDEPGTDTIDFKKVIAVGVVSLVIFALASWWAATILHSERSALGPRVEWKAPTEIGNTEIGIVDQVPFQGDVRLDKWKTERAEWLNGYGWVDRARGVAHIPIDRAMDEIVAGASPPPPAPETMPPGGTR